ncbi:MAG: RtcB family protein [Nitratireductor sp.]|nr:RtcB family protein [Nitratireductor sp.]
MTGKDLIEMGFAPGPHFPAMIAAANKAAESGDDVRAAVADLAPPDPICLRQQSLSFFENIRAENDDERDNVEAVRKTMNELMRTPVLKAGAVMPDACPAGSVGTIPVGGVVASEAIHPGMHSADICCSMALTNFGRADPLIVLDAMHRVTHFGPGGREEIRMPDDVAKAVDGNTMTRDFIDIGHRDMGTQGDGNHFAYVGQLKSTGDTVLVTHHGSRGFGARVYKRGMRVADNFRRKLSPETPKGNAWIPADTKEGETYWDALQIVREWTKANHYVLHDMAAEAAGIKSLDRFWNEHNFVFRKSDGLFYHGKGATPAFDGWASDATDLTIIPLNMAEPILIVRGQNASNGLGFSPHGAGRNFSRTQHRRRNDHRTDAEIFTEETAGIDARFFMGIPDISELPSAYKNAASVRSQIDEYGLAEIVDEVLPFGCIMAGDWEKEAPWRKLPTPQDKETGR